MPEANIPPPSSSKLIVIIGGSYGGISTAHYILKHVLPSLPAGSHHVVLVSASTQAMCRPACPRAMISDEMFPQAKLFVDINELFKQYPKGSFRFVHGTATELDHGSRKVSVLLAGGGDEQTKETLDFHALIIATGASTPSPLLGLNRDEAFLKLSWAAFRQALPAARTIVIAGGGPSGVETAGELAEHLNGRPGWFSSRCGAVEDKVKITLVTAGSRLLPVLRPPIAEEAERQLARLGVEVVKNVRVSSVAPSSAGTGDPASPASLTLEDGTALQADLYIPTTGTTPNAEFVHASLLAPDGRVETNGATLRVDAAGPRVYALGDVASSARPAVHSVLAAVPVLCRNLKRDLLLVTGAAGGDGKGPETSAEDAVFKEDSRETQLVPIGRRGGVGAAMGYRLPGFLVWLVKGRDYWLWTTGALWNGKQWEKAT